MKKILVIDDEGLITKTIGSLLKREGYEVGISNSGQQAVTLIEKSAFDLIISDLRMPGMDGLETAEKIRAELKQKNKPTIPVVFITGYAEGDLPIRAQQLGKVIYKPFDMQDFLKTIRSAISGEKK